MTVAAVANPKVANPSPHPCKGALAIARISNKRIAAMLGISDSYASRQINGIEHATPALRRVVVGLLNRPEGELFRDEQVRRWHRRRWVRQ